MNSEPSLKDLNTFGFDVRCNRIVRIDSVEVLKSYISETESLYMILGGGSNVLFTSNFQGDILLNSLSGKDILEESHEFVKLKIGSGENWHELVNWCVNNGFGGIENMAMIPGSVGAAPIQNIGAYGVEIKDVLNEVEFINLETQIPSTLLNDECNFAYRNSIFKNELKGKVFITSITITLQKNRKPDLSYWALSQHLTKNRIEDPSILDVFNAVVAVRQSKLPDPAVLGNSGSFFKNPVLNKEAFERALEEHPDLRYFEIDDQRYKVAAGWLIEQCGWKGKRIGNTGCHDKQALVLVNYGDATGEEVWNLAKEIIKSVDDKFGITLEAEVNII